MRAQLDPVIKQYLLTVLQAAQHFGRGKALLSPARDKEAALAELRWSWCPRAEWLSFVLCLYFQDERAREEYKLS